MENGICGGLLAASLMLNHGIPVIVVSQILGHSKPSITMDIYGHLYNEMQDEAAQLMDEIVTLVQIELTDARVIARSRYAATKQSPGGAAEIASHGKERRVRNHTMEMICTQLHQKNESLLIEQAQPPDVGVKR